MNSENLLRQAMRNSGIVIERVAMEEAPKADEPAAAAAEELENEVVEAEEEPCGEQCVKAEQAESVCLYSINRLIFFTNLVCLHMVVDGTISLTTPHVILSTSPCARVFVSVFIVLFFLHALCVVLVCTRALAC